jgi:hypothetical protein
VWNEAQKREAESMHGVDPARIVITGAMVYDQWFARRPSTTREDFCARVGLDPSRPILLYLCSSPFIAPDELNFIEEWIAAIRRASDPRVATAGILIRPHPENRQPWHRFDASTSLGAGVAVWPRGGASPVDAASKNDFYDSMYHAAAAVGINTSAQIECGIVGRPVFSVRTPAYQKTQEGTLHFRHLTTEGGGLLRIANDFGTHVQQIAEALADPEGTAARVKGFVKAFTRPYGLDVAATPKIVDTIETLAAAPPPAPERLPAWVYPLRAVLYPIALLNTGLRRFRRLTRKRSRQLRPVTAAGSFVKVTLAVIDGLFRLRPVRSAVKQHILPHAISRLALSDAPTEEAVAIRRLLHRLARRDRPVIVGPWVSEVGYELLYWIPFLRWVREQSGIDSERLVVVSRGGVAAWYRDVTTRYVDLFDYFSPETLRDKSEQRVTEGKLKPRTMTEFDRDMVKLVRQTLHLGSVEVLHPMHMYRLFQAYWQSRVPDSTINQFARVKPLAATPGELAAVLPADYVAVRFYFNEAFPDTPANRQFASGMIEALTETTDVVLLTPESRIDDHPDVSVDTRRRLHSIAHLMTPRTNLDVQSRVIAGARAFVGTHGGLSYLAPFYGVKSVSFYSQAQPSTMRHLEHARRAFASLAAGSCVALDVTDLDALRAALGEPHSVLSRTGEAEAVARLARRLS